MKMREKIVVDAEVKDLRKILVNLPGGLLTIPSADLVAALGALTELLQEAFRRGVVRQREYPAQGSPTTVVRTAADVVQMYDRLRFRGVRVRLREGMLTTCDLRGDALDRWVVNDLNYYPNEEELNDAR